MIDKKILFENYIRDLNSIGLDISDKQLDMFYKYYEILIEWNSFMNLTAITDPEDVFKKHFTDSLLAVRCELIDLNKINSLIDVGTGAGFPGIPLKIMFPDINVTLMDSLGKRVKFLNEVISLLGLSGINAIHSRAEDLSRKSDHRDNYDICVSRAVAGLNVLSEYCLPFVKPGGFFISYKSEKAAEEASGSEKGLSYLNGKLVDMKELELPGTDNNRTFVIIKKTGPTPKRFPRKAGTPTKEPLW